MRLNNPSGLQQSVDSKDSFFCDMIHRERRTKGNLERPCECERRREPQGFSQGIFEVGVIRDTR